MLELSFFMHLQLLPQPGQTIQTEVEEHSSSLYLVFKLMNHWIKLSVARSLTFKISQRAAEKVSGFACKHTTDDTKDNIK